MLTQIMRFKEAADPNSCSHKCSDGSICGGEYFMTLHLTPQVRLEWQGQGRVGNQAGPHTLSTLMLTKRN